MGIPAEFRMPDFDRAKDWGKTSFNEVLKPVAGALGSLYAKFMVHKEYSGADSEEAGEEVYRNIELCLIKTDKFSEVPLRVGQKGEKKQDKAIIERTLAKLDDIENVDDKIKDKVAQAIRRSGVVVGKITSELSRQQEIDLAPLFNRFREQKDSTDTDVVNWQALSDGERSLLVSQNIFTVEQLYHTPQEQRYRLGPGGEELWERSQRFMKSKQKQADAAEHMEELRLLREEIEKQAQRDAERDDQMFALQAELAALKEQAQPKKGMAQAGA